MGSSWCLPLFLSDILTHAHLIAIRIKQLRGRVGEAAAEEEASLATALLEAAKRGTLGEITYALEHWREFGRVAHRNRYNVINAYISIWQKAKRQHLPNIGAILETIRLKPNQGPEDRNTVTYILADAGLPWSDGKIGYPLGRKRQKH